MNKSTNKTAWFEFAKPVQIAKGQQLMVRLHHSSGSKRHNLGRFRISTTTDGRPKLRFAAVATVVLEPGGTASCRLRVERFGFGGRISFDVQNLPHGVIVNDIGLSGVLIPEGETERTIFLNAQGWVPETDRLFHAIAKVDGNQVSLPMLLKVRRKKVAQGR